MHRERHTVIIGEACENSRNLAGSVSSIRGIKTRILRKIEMIEVFCDINDCIFTHTFAIVVDEDIAHDGENPSLEIGVLGKLPLVVKSFKGVS